MPLVSLADIEAAAERIRDMALRTPLLRTTAPSHSRTSPASLYLKAEHLQPMGAFKMRGAANFLAQLEPQALAAGVITYSSGNHGLALALAARRLGARAVVVMPETAPHLKVAGVRRYGAEVIPAGRTSLERTARAEAEAAARRLTIVPPFDHPWIIAGAGTCGVEIVEDCSNLAAVYVPVGGGGLLAGVAAAVKALQPHARVVGVEPVGAAGMVQSRAAGRPVTLDATSSIADGLLPLRPGDLTFAHMQALVDDVITVDEDQIRAGVGWLYRAAGITAEPRGAVSVAGALGEVGPAYAGPHVRGSDGGAGFSRPVVAIVSGGNVSPADHDALLRSLPRPS
jgi:threonine dehydratase